MGNSRQTDSFDQNLLVSADDAAQLDKGRAGGLCLLSGGEASERHRSESPDHPIAPQYHCSGWNDLQPHRATTAKVLLVRMTPVVAGVSRTVVGAGRWARVPGTAHLSHPLVGAFRHPIPFSFGTSAGTLRPQGSTIGGDTP